MNRPKNLVPLVVLLLVGVAASAQEKNEKKPPKDDESQQYLRVARDDNDNLLALQVAIVRFVPKAGNGQGVVVDLVSAVHVAEESYYDDLNQRFQKYDAVLYELVAPEGTKIPKGGGRTGGSPVSFLQKGITQMLDLEFQLEGVDYTLENMVHADMSPKQFAESMKKRGESVFGMFMSMFKQALAKQQKSTVSDAELLAALFNKNRALALKRIMAEQFQEMEGMLTALSGPEGSTIITERNKVALDVLRREMKPGKKKTFAIFYGAGHMPDFHERLEKDFDMVPAKTTWVDAWKLTDGKPAATDSTDAKVKEDVDANPAEAQDAADKPTPKSKASRKASAKKKPDRKTKRNRKLLENK